MLSRVLLHLFDFFYGSFSFLFLFLLFMMMMWGCGTVQGLATLLIQYSWVQFSWYALCFGILMLLFKAGQKDRLWFQMNVSFLPQEFSTERLHMAQVDGEGWRQ